MVTRWAVIFSCIFIAFCHAMDDNDAIASKVRDEYRRRYNWTIHHPFTQYEGQDTGIDGAYNYSQYQPFQKIERELHRLADGSNDDVSNGVRSELLSIGKTYEGRDIWALKVQRKATSQNETKNIVLIECGTHAREWISVSTCMFLLRQFTHNTAKVKDVLDKYDWVFIPVLNPDGYVFTWYNSSTRNWRKNRSIDPHAKHSQVRTLNDTMINLCIGVDINRNFDVMWGGAQAPTEEPCDIMYPGPEPFSEKESTGLANYVLSEKEWIIAYFSLHTFSLKWATPWAHQKVHPNDYDEMKRVADIAVESIKTFAGISYMVGSTHDILYPSAGTSTDWVYAQADVVYTYLVEMIPSKGNIPNSFMLPPEMMLMNAQDMLTGIVSAAQEFRPKPRDKRSSQSKHTNVTSFAPLRAQAHCIMGNGVVLLLMLFVSCAVT